MEDRRRGAKIHAQMRQWTDNSREFWRSFELRWARWRQEHPTSLFVASALSLAVLAMTALVLWFGLARVLADRWPNDLIDPEISQYSVIRMVLFILAGAIGAIGVIGVVVAYRRQHSVEQGRFLERLADASRLLGDANPTIQAAGITALAGLADTEGRARRQQCVDVLCAYIRLPYAPAPEGHEPVALENVLRRRTLRTRTGPIEEERTLFRPHDRHTRETIIRVIVQHLRADAAVSWSDLDFDFTGAVFDYGDFSGINFSKGTVDFKDCKFAGGIVSFWNSNFAESKVNFTDVEFSGSHVDFSGSVFSEGHWLNRNIVSFIGAKFTGGTVNFWNAKVSHGTVSFSDAKFSGAIVKFSGITLFGNGVMNFDGARFDSGTVDFEKAQFEDGAVRFDDAKFSGGTVGFEDVCIDGGYIEFENACFNGAAVNFRESHFSRGTVDFGKAKFSGGTVDFTGAAFMGSTVDFVNAAFGRGTVIFDQSNSWAVEPKVPWRDGEEPPFGVMPRQWPPQFTRRSTDDNRG